MQLRKRLQTLIRLFDHPGGRWIISAGIPFMAKFSAHGVRKLHYQSGWIHHFADGITVEPSPRMRNLHLDESINKFIWGFVYTPNPGDLVLDVGAGLGQKVSILQRKSVKLVALYP